MSDLPTIGVFGAAARAILRSVATNDNIIRTGIDTIVSRTADVNELLDRVTVTDNNIVFQVTMLSSDFLFQRRIWLVLHYILVHVSQRRDTEGKGEFRRCFHITILFVTHLSEKQKGRC